MQENATGYDGFDRSFRVVDGALMRAVVIFGAKSTTG